MSPATQLIAPGSAFTAGPNISTLGSDPALNAGSVFLFDAAGLPPTGVPANPTNLAAARLATLTGQSGTALQFSYAPSGAGLTGTAGLMERTGKGGLHGITSRTALANGQGARLNIPDAAKSHIRANPNRQYGYALWQHTTRESLNNVLPNLFIGTSEAVGLHAYMYKVGFRPPAATPQRLGSVGDNDVVGTPALRAVGVNGWWTGTGSTATVPADNTFEGCVPWGSVGALGSNRQTQTPSFIVYRLVCEDLTTSGRTWAQFLAMEQELHAAAFGSNGRFVNDTFTNPTTIA